MIFTLKDGRQELYQWDTGRAIVLSEGCEYVHFANCNTVKGTYNVSVEKVDGQYIAKIPDELLQVKHPLKVYAYVNDGDGNYTEYKEEFTINGRPKPADYVYTPTEIHSYNDLDERVTKTEEEISRKADAHHTHPGIEDILLNIYGITAELDNNKANKDEIPSKVSQLENDKGYLTEHQDISGKADKTDTYTKFEFDEQYDELVGRCAENSTRIDTINVQIGDIETALDNIIDIQNTLIGGDNV